MTKRTVPVSERALVQRINRKFIVEDGLIGRQLKKTRAARATHTLGDYFILHVQGNFVVEHHVDPESLGRDLGALADWEYVVEE